MCTFFIWQTPCENRWSWVFWGFIFRALQPLRMYWFIACPEHKPDWPLLWWCNCCCYRWLVIWAISCFTFVTVHAPLKQTSCRNRLNRRSNQTVVHIYSVCILLSKNLFYAFDHMMVLQSTSVSTGVEPPDLFIKFKWFSFADIWTLMRSSSTGFLCITMSFVINWFHAHWCHFYKSWSIYTRFKKQLQLICG